nr:hypothetical protein [Micromonospora sp. DSM 115978]
MRDLFVARTSGVIMWQGRRHPLQRGVTIAHPDHPLRVGHPKLWKPLHVHYDVKESPAAAPVVERATARPGEQSPASSPTADPTNADPTPAGENPDGGDDQGATGEPRAEIPPTEEPTTADPTTAGQNPDDADDQVATAEPPVEEPAAVEPVAVKPAPPRMSGAGSGVGAWREYAAAVTNSPASSWEALPRDEIVRLLRAEGVIE